MKDRGPGVDDVMERFFLFSPAEQPSYRLFPATRFHFIRDFSFPNVSAFPLIHALQVVSIGETYRFDELFSSDTRGKV